MHPATMPVTRLHRTPIHGQLRLALDRLTDLDLPVFVLLGGHDLDTTADAADRVCVGTPHAQRVDWTDVAHMPSKEKPQQFLDLLLDWMGTHE